MDTSKLPVGIQTFSEIRNCGLIYVDKTDLVYRLANTCKYNFLSRPRRFGKSLLLSTLQAYFEGRQELFEGLRMQHLENDWEKYPVLRFDMNNGEYRTHEGLVDTLNEQIEPYEHRYGVERSGSTLSTRLKRLIISACRQTGKRVVVLVDEYEKPVLETIGYPELQEQHRGLLKPFYATLKSCDEYIRFVMLTGVSKMGHLSVFSDLNNVVNLTLDPQYATICGFTREEIEQCFGAYVAAVATALNVSVDQTMSLLKEQYDGYRFSRSDAKVFNPYSLLNAMRAQYLSDFWFETGTPSFLVNILRMKHFRINELEGLAVRPNQLAEIDDGFSNPVPLLYQSGYLTIKDFNALRDQYILGYPNREVRRGFLESLMPNYLSMSSYESAREVGCIERAAIEGRVDDVMKSIETMIMSIPTSPREVYEYLYRDSVYLIFRVLGFDVHSEVSMLSGRIDCVIETPGYVYVMEFKANSSAQEAIRQISDKNYTMPYVQSARKVFTIGVNFDTDTRRMTYIIG